MHIIWQVTLQNLVLRSPPIPLTKLLNLPRSDGTQSRARPARTGTYAPKEFQLSKLITRTLGCVWRGMMCIFWQEVEISFVVTPPSSYIRDHGHATCLKLPHDHKTQRTKQFSCPHQRGSSTLGWNSVKQNYTKMRLIILRPICYKRIRGWIHHPMGIEFTETVYITPGFDVVAKLFRS